MHEVLRVSCPSKAFADSRFTINGWVRKANWGNTKSGWIILYHSAVETATIQTNSAHADSILKGVS
jgi:Rps23 Pro-64 3,4-dihydroxylase Tpa1-like proline 4-hydroxylase